MIVNKTIEGWKIIFQRHHALLAARIGRQLKNLLPLPPLDSELIAAIAEHDDGQRDWHDGKFVNEEGAPIDFSAYDYDLKHATESVKEASYKSAYINLIISRHITELYSQAEKPSGELLKYLDRQRDSQNALQEVLSLTKKELDSHYELLRWCDELSLALCRNERSCQLPSLGGHPSYCLHADKNEFSLWPWPFQSENLSFPIESYEIKVRKFKSTLELFEKLKHTAPIFNKVAIIPA